MPDNVIGGVDGAVATLLGILGGLLLGMTAALGGGWLDAAVMPRNANGALTTSAEIDGDDGVASQLRPRT